MNIYDISKKAGVSIATVSRVINNSSKVSEATRKKVLSFIRDANYVPHSRKNTLNKSWSVSYVCTSLSHYSSAFFADHISSMLRHHGCHVDIISCGNDIADKKQALEYALSNKCRSIFIDGTDFLEYAIESNTYIAQAALKSPVFLLNAFMDAPNIYCAFYDTEKSIYAVTDSLLKQGRSKPLFLFTAMSTLQMAMLDGFKMALELNGLNLIPEMTQLCEPDNLAIKEYMTKLIDGGYRPDCIITSDDRLAACTVYVLQNHFPNEPDHFSVVTGNLSNMHNIIKTDDITVINCLGTDLCSHMCKSFLSLNEGGTIPRKTIFPTSILT